MRNRLFNRQKKQREVWDQTLQWFRLRYGNAVRTVHAINILSRAQNPGRVALYYEPGELTKLYIGIPHEKAEVLQRMSSDFGFSVKTMGETAVVPIDRLDKLASAASLPLERTFTAHIVNECLFVSTEDGQGDFFPCPPTLEAGRGSATWTLPESPPLGLTASPKLERPIPKRLVVTEPTPNVWLLGRSQAGPLGTTGRVNVYGTLSATSEWLSASLTRFLSIPDNQSHLVVIDGAGDLIPKLTRKKSITRLLVNTIEHVNIDALLSTYGFNPLASLPGEVPEGTNGRWVAWFKMMGIRPTVIPLLQQAHDEGIYSLAKLRQWVIQAERTHDLAASAATIGVFVERFLMNKTVKAWVHRPNAFDLLPEKILFLSCKAGEDWARQQLLRGMLLAAQRVKGVRLIVHGFPWKGFDLGYLSSNGTQIMASNSPPFPSSTIALVECGSDSAYRLSRRFFPDDHQLTENLQLLQAGDGLIINESDVVLTTWRV